MSYDTSLKPHSLDNSSHIQKPQPSPKKDPDPGLTSILSALKRELTYEELGRIVEIYNNIKKLKPKMTEREIIDLCAILFKVHDLSLSKFNHIMSRQAHSPRGFVTDGNITFIHAKEKGGAKKVGSGGFKTVYTAYHVDFNTFEVVEVVHKKGDYEDFDSLKKEVETQKRFHAHPNVESIFGDVEYSNPGTTYVENYVAFYAEKCDGTMEDVLRNASMPFEEKLQVMIGAASALAFMHLQGQCHNDIKPDNLLLKDTQARLTDFGLSAISGATLPKFCSRTVSPEQFKCNTFQPQPIGTLKTDVYQFGLMLYQTFHPNPESNHLDVDYTFPASKDLFTNWPSETHKEMRELIKGCLAENPEDRPSMALVQKMLETIQPESTT